MRDAEVLADADERDPLPRHLEPVQAREDVDDLQLVVEIRFEPEDVLAGEERGPDPPQLRVRNLVGHRPL